MHMHTAAPPDQHRFVNDVLPLVERRARWAFWYLTCPARREDAIQDARLHAWAGWLYLHRVGRVDAVSPWCIARMAVSRAKCGHSHHGVGRTGKRNIVDALDWRCQRRAGFRT